MITQTELKEFLRYDPETGVFTWLAPPAYHIRAGDIAGYLNDRGYIIIGINKKSYRAHRLAWLYMKGVWPKQIDHDDHVKDNNKWNNLFEATQQENNKNLPISKHNTSGVTGVYWNKARNKWKAYIYVNYKNKHLGSYVDWFEAVCARKSAENKYSFHPNHGR